MTLQSFDDAHSADFLAAAKSILEAPFESSEVEVLILTQTEPAAIVVEPHLCE